MKFFNSTIRRPLSICEVDKLVHLFKCTIKVGTEIEGNLLESSGTCTGISEYCPCIKLTPESNCWKKCANTDCEVINKFSTCKFKCDTCVNDDCIDCSFNEKCYGIACNMFIPNCIICSEYVKNCKSCKYLLDKDKNPKYVRKYLRNVLKPTKSYGHIGSSGVHEIVTDGSLLGGKGVEVITSGRRPMFDTFYTMFKNILSVAKEKGMYFNERCSVHMHGLVTYHDNNQRNKKNSPQLSRAVSYSNPHSNSSDESDRNNSRDNYDIELEHINDITFDSVNNTNISELDGAPIPEIILANLHQLIRKYQNALTWLGMGLNDINSGTRWEKFRTSILDTSASTYHMIDVINMLANSSSNSRYSFINYTLSEFDNNGDISKFHVEFRNLDGIDSPTLLAAFSNLYYALIIKAVEISKYGIMEAFASTDDFKIATRMKNAILNNTGDYSSPRFSDTSTMLKFRELFISESKEMLDSLKHILDEIGPSYHVLKELAIKPIPFLFIEKYNWDTIEKKFFDVAIANTVDTTNIYVLNIYKKVELDNTVYPNKNDWKKDLIMSMKGKIDVNMEKLFRNISDTLDNLVNNGKIYWSANSGAYKK